MLNVLTAVGGLNLKNQSNQVLKRVNSIAQDPKGVTGLYYSGYYPDGAKVEDFYWNNFVVGQSQVNLENFLSAGYFPFNNNNFTFDEIEPWYQEEWGFMTTGPLQPGSPTH